MSERVEKPIKPTMSMYLNKTECASARRRYEDFEAYHNQTLEEYQLERQKLQKEAKALTENDQSVIRIVEPWHNNGSVVSTLDTREKLIQKKLKELGWLPPQTLEHIKSEISQSCEQMVDITKSAERKSYITLEKTFAILDKHRGEA